MYVMVTNKRSIVFIWTPKGKPYIVTICAMRVISSIAKNRGGRR